jgi:hypothetical protein
VGRGTLPNAMLPEAKTGEAPGDIRFVWADNSGIGTAAATDKAIAVVYLPAAVHWGYFGTRVNRSDGALVYSLGSYKGTVHTWLVFISGNGKASDSVYTGMLEI